MDQNQQDLKLNVFEGQDCWKISHQQNRGEETEQFMEGTLGNILVSSTMTTPKGRRSMQLPLLCQDLSSRDTFSQSKVS